MYSYLLLINSANRFEAFNSLIRTQNVFGNKQAPSRDIAITFAHIEHLRSLCSGNYGYTVYMYAILVLFFLRCGQGVIQLYNHPQFQSFLNCVPLTDLQCHKDIYQPGSFRKVHNYYNGGVMLFLL